MSTRVALIGIVVEDNKVTERLNSLLHQYGEYVIGRMGIPYRARDIYIISVAVDAPEATISALAGKLGMIPGVSVKIVYTAKDTKSSEK
jgi:putative iron-only hydrogenase system regulator